MLRMTSLPSVGAQKQKSREGVGWAAEVEGLWGGRTVLNGAGGESSIPGTYEKSYFSCWTWCCDGDSLLFRPWRTDAIDDERLQGTV